MDAPGKTGERQWFSGAPWQQFRRPALRTAHRAHRAPQHPCKHSLSAVTTPTGAILSQGACPSLHRNRCSYHRASMRTTIRNHSIHASTDSSAGRGQPGPLQGCNSHSHNQGLHSLWVCIGPASSCTATTCYYGISPCTCAAAHHHSPTP